MSLLALKRPPARPFLPYGRQVIEEDDVRAVCEVLRGDFLTTGPAVGRFEVVRPLVLDLEVTQAARGVDLGAVKALGVARVGASDGVEGQRDADLPHVQTETVLPTLHHAAHGDIVARGPRAGVWVWN